MSANKYAAHILILPEDGANANIATGFQLELGGIALKQLQILPAAGGWESVVALFESNHVANLETYPLRLMVLLVDGDEKPDRFQKVRDTVPVNLRDRVFVLGAADEPERVKASLQISLEEIGERLASECRDRTNATWRHAELRHNDAECERLRNRVAQWLL